MRKRRCLHCFRDHLFERDEDDRDECPRCDGGLEPITSQVSAPTASEIEAAKIQDDLAVLVENALEDDALTIWGRVDDASPGQAIKVTDVAGRIAKRLVDGIQPMIRLVIAARAFARRPHARDATHGGREPTVACVECSKASVNLLNAAHALEYGCRECGDTRAELDDRRLCQACVTPKIDPEAEFNSRCGEALAAVKDDPGRFAAATRAIVAERPQITMVEFIDRATRGAETKR